MISKLTSESAEPYALTEESANLIALSRYSGGQSRNLSDDRSKFPWPMPIQLEGTDSFQMAAERDLDDCDNS
jgi:hypothetical protein